MLSSLFNFAQFKKRWRVYVAGGVTALIATIFLINTVPLITGEIGTLFVPRHIPEDYLKLKDFILSQDEYFRTFWTPRDSRWGIYTNQHPKISNVSLIGGDWALFVDPTKFRSPHETRDKIVSVLQLPYADALLNSGAVKYVIVPLEDRDNDDNFFVHYGMGRAFYVRTLDALPYLHKIDIGTHEVTVYENEGYMPYIRAMDDVLSFATHEDLAGKYRFATEALGKSFDFVIEDAPEDVRGLPFVALADLADGVQADSFDARGLHLALPAHGGITSVYADTGVQQLSFAGGNDRIVITGQKENNLFFDGAPLAFIPTTTPKILAEVARDPALDYYLESEGRIIPLPLSGVYGALGAYPHPARILAAAQTNLVKNPSFDEGLWRDAVGDCNNYDDHGLLDMRLLPIDPAARSPHVEKPLPLPIGNGDGLPLSASSTPRVNVLELSATRHTACTGPDRVPVTPGQDYVLSFAYQSDHAKHAGYYVSFPGTDLTLGARLPINGASWHTFRRVITAPADARDLALTVYSYAEDNRTAIRVRYDDFALQPMDENGKNTVFLPHDTPQFHSIALQPGADELRTFMYREEGYRPVNLIPNPSLENGLWQTKVGDCNNYDEDGALSMRWDRGDAADGGAALALGATRHIACTGPGIIAVRGGRDYLFSFSYASANGTQAGYYLGFNNASSTTVSEKLPVAGDGWQRFHTIIAAPAGATTASLVVYSYADDGRHEIVTRYDDFHLHELPALRNRYYVVSEPEEKLQKPREVSYEIVNPTKKRVRVRGATTPFFLAMSESYHDQWRLTLDNGEVNGLFQSWIPWVRPDRVGDEAHFKLNGFLNGWYVDPAALCTKSDTPLIAGCIKNPDGSYDMDMVIEFWPQRFFYLGLLISGITLVSCLGYLGYDYLKQRKIS